MVKKFWHHESFVIKEEKLYIPNSYEQFIKWKKKHNLCPVKIKISDFKITWTDNQTLDLQISSLALYQLSYPGSVDSAGLNNSLVDQQVADSVTYHKSLTVALFFKRDILNQYRQLN